jgi:hypothetical protein
MAEASFKNGKKHNPDGTVCEAVRMKEPLSSNGHTKYCTVYWDDDTYSCNCPGWAFRNKGGVRQCKHTKASVKCAGRDMVDVNSISVEALPAYVAGPTGRQFRRIQLKKK